jgi:hypothetical protein
MADAGEEPTRTLVETFFTPTTRGRDIDREKTRTNPVKARRLRHFAESEWELSPDVLSNRCTKMDMTWEDFCRFLWAEDIVWLTPELFVTTCKNRYGFAARDFEWTGFVISTPIRDRTDVPPVQMNEEILTVYVFSVTGRAWELARTPASAWEFLLGLLARSQQPYIRIGYCNNDGRDQPSFPISGHSLSTFFQEIDHQHVTLAGFTLDEDQCRALAAVSSPGLEINLERCQLAPYDYGCREVFIECLQRDRGPTELDRCIVSNRILTSALTGNTRVVKLRICGKPVPDNAGLGILFRSLPNMRGLLELSLYEHYIIDTNWHILCESLKMNRTLTCLDLRRNRRWNEARPTITNEQKVHRTRAIAEMLEVNAVLHTIKLSPSQIEQNICRESVNPRLETNRYRPRVLAIKQADNRSRRALLGRALQSELVRNQVNILWMFLSENADIVVELIQG